MTVRLVVPESLGTSLGASVEKSQVTRPCGSDLQRKQFLLKQQAPHCLQEPSVRTALSDASRRKWELVAQSCQLFVTPWTVAHQVPLSMGFSRQGYWSGWPCPPPGESSPPRDQTRVSCIVGELITVWITRKALSRWRRPLNHIMGSVVARQI